MGIQFLRILNMSLTASVIILCVMAARLLLKKAPKIFSYALWAVVLFRLLCPVSLTAPVSVLKVTSPQVAESDGISIVYYEPIENAAIQTSTAGPKVQETPVPVQELQTEAKPSALDLASWIWLAGVAVMVLYSIVVYLRLYRSLVGAMQWQGNVYLADHIGSPFVLGGLFPKIYLPSDTPVHERRYIVAHERHHIRRGDHIIKLLAYAALCIHWFNPLVWAAFILAGKDMEMSCDEAVIKKLGEHIRADYSASLLRLATHRRLIAGTPLSFGEGDTKGRVMNMAKWKKPKVWVSMLCIVLCAVIVIACAVNPEQEPAVAGLSGDPLESCKQVVESVQSSDGYLILTDRQNIGGDVLNATSRFRDWKSGDSWLQINKIPESGWMTYFAFLYRDGVFYDNTASAGGRDENGHILWKESITYYQQKNEPWLATFQWKDENVELLSTEEIEDEWQGTLTVVHLAVKDTLRLGEIATEAYTVDFKFDDRGDFYCAVLSAEFPENYFSLVNTMYIHSLDGAAVGQEIEAYWQGGLSSLETDLQDNTITYGGFTVTLPEGYSYRESQGIGLVLTKDGEDVGGITHWNAPDFALTNKNMAEWVEALGLLEAMGGENSYMIDGWSGKYLTASYVDEEDRSRLNVGHNFFEAGELVYDIWFDDNVLSDSEGSKFLKTAYVADEPAVNNNAGS